MRHGQSIWNKKNLFTGWVDIPLSEEGIRESLEGGKKIAHIPIDLVYTSTLIRAQMTAALALLHHASGKVPVFEHMGGRKEWFEIHSEETKKETIPVYMAWELNERMYGKLQGLNKEETALRYGEDQVHTWRRSFDVAPPEGESLEMTALRTLPFFHSQIVPHLEKGKTVFVSAHGNSLRSILMVLDQLSQEEVIDLELPTGEPLLYSYKNKKWMRE